MDKFAESVLDVIAAALRAVGVIGEPRKRSTIREDLALLEQLRAFPEAEFGTQTAPYNWLKWRIYRNIGELAGLDFRTERRKIAWGAVAWSTIFWTGLGWLTYHLVDADYGYWATFPAVTAAVFFFSTLSLLNEKEQLLQDADEPENPTNVAVLRRSMDEIDAAAADASKHVLQAAGNLDS